MLTRLARKSISRLWSPSRVVFYKSFQRETQEALWAVKFIETIIYSRNKFDLKNQLLRLKLNPPESRGKGKQAQSKAQGKPENMTKDESPQQIEKYMKSYFDETLPSTKQLSSIFTQDRISSALHKGKPIFFPTPLTSTMFQYIKYCGTDLVYGLRGTGKTFAIVLYTIMSDKVVKSRVSHLKQEKIAPIQLEQVSKVIYWSVPKISNIEQFSQAKIIFQTGNLILTQCSQIHDTLQSQIDTFNKVYAHQKLDTNNNNNISNRKRTLKTNINIRNSILYDVQAAFLELCEKIKLQYNKLGIRVILIVDQINALMSCIRIVKPLLLAGKSVDQFSDKQKQAYYSGMIYHRITDILYLYLRNTSLYNSSVNFQDYLIGSTYQQQKSVKLQVIGDQIKIVEKQKKAQRRRASDEKFRTFVKYGNNHSPYIKKKISFDIIFEDPQYKKLVVDFIRFELGRKKLIAKEIAEDVNKYLQKVMDEQWVISLQLLNVRQGLQLTSSQNILKQIQRNSQTHFLQNTIKKTVVQSYKNSLVRYVKKALINYKNYNSNQINTITLIQLVDYLKVKAVLFFYSMKNNQSIKCIQIKTEDIFHFNFSIDILEQVFDPEIFYIKEINGVKFIKSYISAEAIDKALKQIKDGDQELRNQIAKIHLIEECSRPEQKGKSGECFEKLLLLGLQKCTRFLINDKDEDIDMEYKFDTSKGSTYAFKPLDGQQFSIENIIDCRQLMDSESNQSLLFIPSSFAKERVCKVPAGQIIEAHKSEGTDFIIASRRDKVVEITFFELTVANHSNTKLNNFLRLATKFDFLKMKGFNQQINSKIGLDSNFKVTINFIAISPFFNYRSFSLADEFEKYFLQQNEINEKKKLQKIFPDQQLNKRVDYLKHYQVKPSYYFNTSSIEFRDQNNITMLEEIALKQFELWKPIKN